MGQETCLRLHSKPEVEASTISFLQSRVGGGGQLHFLRPLFPSLGRWAFEGAPIFLGPVSEASGASLEQEELTDVATEPKAKRRSIVRVLSPGAR